MTLRLPDAIAPGATRAGPAHVLRRFATRAGDHRFFSGMAIVSSLTIVAGFFNTYGPKVMTGEPALPDIIHVHALVFTSWLIVFVAQTTLVLGGRTDLHRRLGAASMVLAALMLAVGVATAITAARMGHRGIPGVEFSDAEGFLLLNLAAISVFAMLVAAAWYFRRNAQAHGPAYDLITRRRVHPAYIWAGLLSLMTVPPVVALLSSTAAWRAFAAWLMQS